MIAKVEVNFSLLLKLESEKFMKFFFYFLNKKTNLGALKRYNINSAYQYHGR
jgi:hypothetical protein